MTIAMSVRIATGIGMFKLMTTFSTTLSFSNQFLVIPETLRAFLQILLAFRSCQPLFNMNRHGTVSMNSDSEFSTWPDRFLKGPDKPVDHGEFELLPHYRISKIDLSPNQQVSCPRTKILSPSILTSRILKPSVPVGFRQVFGWSTTTCLPIRNSRSLLMTSFFSSQQYALGQDQHGIQRNIHWHTNQPHPAQYNWLDHC